MDACNANKKAQMDLIYVSDVIMGLYGTNFRVYGAPYLYLVAAHPIVAHAPTKN